METVDELLDELASLYPMPSEELMTAKYFKYPEIIEKLKTLHDVKCIKPVACSFGYGEMGGVYWSAIHLLETFPSEEVLPILRENLSHSLPGVRQWCASMIGRYRDREAINLLIDLLQDEYEMVRAFAVSALGKMMTPEICEHLRGLQTDSSREVQGALKHAMKKC